MNSGIDVLDGDVGLDLRDVGRRLLEGRWWIASSVVICAAAFAVAAFTMTPVYRATAVLIPASSDRNNMNGSMSSTLGQLGGFASLAGINVGNSDMATEEALAVLRSRQFTSAFIRANDLLLVLFADKWDPVHRRWKDDVSQAPTEYRAYEYFTNKVRTVTQDKKTGLVTLQVDWTDRNLAAQWANDLVARLNAEMRSRQIAKAQDSLGYLQKELASTSTLEVRDAINRLIESQVKQRMLADVTQEYAFRVVDPAVPADADRPIRPNRILLLLLGPIVGLTLGVFIVFLRRL